MTAVSAVTASYWKGTTSTTDSSGFDEDTFLTMLTAQLKYQDPSNPTDSDQLMAQTATLAQVEKMNSMLTATVKSESSTQALTAAQMIGQTVTWKVTDNETGSGVVMNAAFTSDGAVLTLTDGRTLDLDQVTGVGYQATTTATTTTS